MHAAVVASILCTAVPASAQDWIEYQDIGTGFKIMFPGRVKVTTTTWTSEFDYKLPTRVSSAEKDR